MFKLTYKIPYPKRGIKLLNKLIATMEQVKRMKTNEPRMSYAFNSYNLCSTAKYICNYELNAPEKNLNKLNEKVINKFNESLGEDLAFSVYGPKASVRKSYALKTELLVGRENMSKHLVSDETDFVSAIKYMKLVIRKCEYQIKGQL
jgi:hypothetical protein